MALVSCLWAEQINLGQNAGGIEGREYILDNHSQYPQSATAFSYQPYGGGGSPYPPSGGAQRPINEQINGNITFSMPSTSSTSSPLYSHIMGFNFQDSFSPLTLTLQSQSKNKISFSSLVATDDISGFNISGGFNFVLQNLDINFSSIDSRRVNAIQLGYYTGRGALGLQESNITFEEIQSLEYAYGFESQFPQSILFLDSNSKITFQNILSQDARGFQFENKEYSLNLEGGGEISFEKIDGGNGRAYGFYTPKISFKDQTKITFEALKARVPVGLFLANDSSLEGEGIIEFTTLQSPLSSYGIYNSNTHYPTLHTISQGITLAFDFIASDHQAYGIYNIGDSAFDLQGNITFKHIESKNFKSVGLYHQNGAMTLGGKVIFENISSTSSGNLYAYGLQNNGDMILYGSLIYGTPALTADQIGIYDTLGINFDLGNLTILTSETNAIGIKGTDRTMFHLSADKTLHFGVFSDQEGIKTEGKAFDGGNLFLSSNSRVIFDNNGGNLHSLTGNGWIILSGIDEARRIDKSSTIFIPRSLEITHFNAKDSKIILFAANHQSNINTAGYDGRSYDDGGAQISTSGSDALIIKGTHLVSPANNTLTLKVNDLTGWDQNYTILAKVGENDAETKNNVIFNGLTRDKAKTKIRIFKGFETSSIDLQRYDDGNTAYYVVGKTTADDESNNGSDRSEEGNNGGGSSGDDNRVEGENDRGGSSNEGIGGDNTGNNGNTDNGGAGGGLNGGSDSSGENDNSDPITIEESFARSTIGSVQSNFFLLSANLNSLNKRMGDLRYEQGIHGIWARFFYGEQDIHFATESKDTYYSFQAGYDYAFALKDSTNYLGIALTYTRGQNNQSIFYESLNQNAKENTISDGVEIALYNAYVSSGFYSDSIAKVSYFSSQTNYHKQSKQNNIQNYALSLSQEFGYLARFGNHKEWKITPQMEISYSHLNKTDFTRILDDGSTLQVRQDEILMVRTRAGVDWRYDFSHFSKNVKANVYVGTYYLFDAFIGGGITTMRASHSIASYDMLKSNGRMLLNVGTNLHLFDSLGLYLDFEKSFFGKHINTNYQVNFGARYSFGRLGQRVAMKSDNESEKAPLELKNTQISKTLSEDGSEGD